MHTGDKKKILFLISGNGGNLKFFFKCSRIFPHYGYELYAIADRECSAYSFAKKNGIKSCLIKYSRLDNTALLGTLTEIMPDLIISTFHKILDEVIVEKFFGKIINLHYSLLPAFSGVIGVKPIEKAVFVNCKIIGATVHVVDKDVDAGPILCQCAIPVGGAAISELSNRIFQLGCIILFNECLKILFSPIGEERQYYDNNSIISPNLIVFDLSLVDSLFWNELSYL